jgi:CDP-paratose 2-epimerase
MLEAIELVEKITSRKMQIAYSDDNRIGDHIWYISDTRKFQRHYPEWSYRYSLERIIVEMADSLAERIGVAA